MKTGLLEMYKYLPVVALLIGIFVVFFADDVYRYPCQDPLNWNSIECQPPVCRADGTCTENLITLDDSPVTSSQIIDEMPAVDSTDVCQPEDSFDENTEEQEIPLYEEVE